MNRCLCLMLSFILICCSYLSGVYSNVAADIEVPSVQIENSEMIEIYVTQNNEYKLNYIFSPIDYVDEVKSWSSDNENVVIVLSNGTIVPLAVGTATITLETMNGLTDTIEVVVKSGSTINEGEIVKSNNISGSSPIILHSFVPIVSGMYELRLVDYDSNNQRIRFLVYEDGERRPYKNSGGYISGLKSIQFELESGKVYHLGTSLVNPTGNINHTFVLSQVTPSPSPEPTPVPETIIVGDEKEIVVNTINQVQLYMFVPDESGIYKYSSAGSKDVYGEILDLSHNKIAQSDNLYPYYGTYRYQGNFEIEYKFTAGKVYYLESSLPNDSEGMYSVNIEKLDIATAVNIEGKDEIELKYGTEQQLSLNFSPKDARDTIVSWESDNMDVVKVSNSGKIFGKYFGFANITVTTETGLTDTVKVTVIDHEEILEKETKGSWALGEPAYYKFVPEIDGVYELKTWQEFNGPAYPIRIVVYNEKFEIINDLLYSGNVELKADSIYYICVDSLSDDIGDISNFMISKEGNLSDILPSTEPTESLIPSIEPTDTVGPIEIPTPEPIIVPIETIEPEILLGDINGDEKVNAEDALLALQNAAKLIELSESDLGIGDVNVDGRVDAEDALEILKIAAGLVEK